jgi:Flp pilus assembly protein TadG
MPEGVSMNTIGYRDAMPVVTGKQSKRRYGVAMLELAIVMPILLMLLLGIIEMGRVMMINQMATNACREACRRAIVPGADHEAVIQVVNDYLDASGVSKSNRVVQMLDSGGSAAKLGNIGSHESVTVQVSIPYSTNTWGFTSIMGKKSCVAQSTMRRE